MSQISRDPHSDSLARDSVVPPAGGVFPADSGTHHRPPSTTMQGWIYFGAVVMALVGFFGALEGLIALVDKQYFVLRENSLLVISSYATWGWVHLIIGLAAVVTGVSLVVRGQKWARVAGIVIAGLSAVVNLGYLQASPVWSALIITLDVLVIYALTVHGWEIDNS